MRVLKDFSCPCGEESERWVERDAKVADCPFCGHEAALIIRAPRVMWHGKFWAGMPSHTVKPQSTE